MTSQRIDTEEAKRRFRGVLEPPGRALPSTRRVPRSACSTPTSTSTRSRCTPGCGGRRRSTGTITPGLWEITRYEDIMSVARDHKTFCSGRGSRPESCAPRMINTDPPEHNLRPGAS